MKIPRLLSLISMLLVFLAAQSISAQRRTPPAKAPVKSPNSPTPAPSFDNLLAADTYKVYGEVRGVGQLIRSNSVNELLEPVMKLAAPPQEFRTLVKWLRSHADAVMTSRMLVASWPTAKNVPEFLVAIEFGSADEAAKFTPELNEFLPKVFPTPQPEKPGSKSQPQKENSKENSQTAPSYYVKQAGTLLFITSTPLTLKNLHPVGSKPLSEDLNFRTARDRFTSETIFVYVDFQAIEREEENSRQRAIEEEKKREAEQVKAETAAPAKNDTDESAITPPADSSAGPSPELNSTLTVQSTGATPNTTEEKKQSNEVSEALSGLAGSFFGGRSKWPEAIGVGLSLENDSFDVRALLINGTGEKSDAVPFFPLLVPGPAISPQSPSILPSDTELFVTMSLDLDQIYAGLNTRPATSMMPVSSTSENSPPVASPFTAIEKVLGVKIREEVLPLLGNEVVFSMPVKALEPNHPTAAPSPGTETAVTATSPSPILGLSLRDKEGMRALLPRLVDRLGFNGASSMAQTEKRDDTEIVSFANAFAYAFIGDFLVLSGDIYAIHHVVDSYLKRETLSSDTQFKNYTRWQPRQLQGQVYVSPALMESYKAWASEPNSLISDSTREFLLRLSVVAEPVTYSLSNEGFGPLHEVHLPKNLVLMAVAGMAGESSPPPSIANERRAMSAVYTITWAEREFKSKKGGAYATLDQLLSENFVSKGTTKTEGYKIELIVSGSQYQISAVPTEYGTTGRKSYFADESGVVRSGDHGGAPATVSDRPVQ